MIKKIIFFIMCFILFTSVYAQEISHTLSKDSSQVSPPASLEDIMWLAGSWKGEAFGGKTEEIWSAPLGGSMMGSFKLVVNNKVSFYEFMTINEENNSIILKIKHFNNELKGWEEKDVTVDFPLVKVAKDLVYFDKFTIERVSDKEINIYLLVHDKDGENEIKFNYHRVN